MMLSQAAKTYDRSNLIKPLNKKQRQKMYQAKSVIVQKKVGQKKYSPFNTISRDARNSYLLRVTHEPNTQTNYEINQSFVSPTHRRPTIDKAKFKRIIGDVRGEDFSVQLSPNSDKRCIKSQTLSPSEKRPLTVRDHQKWRKTFQHMDFKKQQSTRRVKMFPKLQLEDSTNISAIKTLRETIESNFNNFDRFKFKPKEYKAHSFKSDFGHEYLKEVQTRQRSPEYNIEAGDESIIRKSMAKPKGFLEIDKYRQVIATRFDRNDPQWYTKLNYTSREERNSYTIHFDQFLDRKPNDINSKYPIRLSLEKITKVRGG